MGGLPFVSRERDAPSTPAPQRQREECAMRIGDRARVMFREHSIPTTARGEVIRIEHGYVTIRADDWEGEAGNLVCVPRACSHRKRRSDERGTVDDSRAPRSDTRSRG